MLRSMLARGLSVVVSAGLLLIRFWILARRDAQLGKA